MDDIASNFKIASSDNDLRISSSSVGDTMRSAAFLRNPIDLLAAQRSSGFSSSGGFRGSKFSTPSVETDMRGFIVAVVIFLCIAYYYRESLLSMAKSGGIADNLWSALYLTSKGEVATTIIPDTSVANALL
jgi:hypothetical protein